MFSGADYVTESPENRFAQIWNGCCIEDLTLFSAEKTTEERA